MLDSWAPLVDGFTKSLTGQIFLAAFVLALVFVGYQFMFGNHERATQQLKWTLIGGGGVLLARTVATAVIAAVPH